MLSCFLRPRRHLCLAALALSAPCLASAQARYTITDLGTLGGPTSSAAAINNRNQIVGTADTAWKTSANQTVTHAFLYDNGTLTDIDPDPTHFSSASGINYYGDIIGTLTVSVTQISGFLKKGTTLTPFGGYYASPLAINDQGQITGNDKFNMECGHCFTAFLYADGVETPILKSSYSSLGAAINNNGQVGGYRDDTSETARATLYADGTEMVLLPSGTISAITGINDLGDVVGQYLHTPTGFAYTNGVLTPIAMAAADVNNLRQVVGYYVDSSGTYSYLAALYEGTTVQDLNNLIPANSGWILTQANAINDNGWIVGTGFSGTSGIRAFLLKPITPPAQVVVQGSVLLEGYTDYAVPLTLEFRSQTGGVSFTRTVTPASNGNFVVTDAGRDRYLLAIKGSKWLQKDTMVDTTGGAVRIPDITLKVGDANNDNRIDIGDFGFLVNAYSGDTNVPGSGYDAATDFNGDGMIDVADFSLLVNNFGTTGDP